MGLFKNAAVEWEKTMTENDLDEMEAQGVDVSAYRAKLAARRAQEAEQAKRDKEMWQNPTNLDKLIPYIATPRSTETPFFRKVAGKAPWFGKSKWLRKYTEGQIIYVGVIDAPDEAWKGGRHEDDMHEIIGVFALDEKHIHNIEWLQKVAEALKNMNEGKHPVVSGCEEIMDMIFDESDWRELKLPDSLAEGADARVRRLIVADKELPKGYLPTNGIVPHFYWEGTIRCIHADLYV
ncbi:hypothetical protein AB9N12_03115 [Bacteroides sp. AN502(2024)]|uniref:hypothetical protein n=1 Tax=Bacteroides sp. AN502(2024) TaxID=3160599 RepID=UPI0035111F6C